MTARPDVPDTPDRTDAVARVASLAPVAALAHVLTTHMFVVNHSAYGSESCACGWSCDGWDAKRYETHLADAILTTDDPAAIAALAATLWERHPDAVLTAGVDAGQLTRRTTHGTLLTIGENTLVHYDPIDGHQPGPVERYTTPWRKA